MRLLSEAMHLRSPTRFDTAVALVVLGVGISELVTGQLQGPGWVAWAAVALSAGAVLVRRTSLWAAVFTVFVTMTASYALGLSQEDFLASIIAGLFFFFCVGYAMPRWESVLGFCFGFGCVVSANPVTIGNLAWLILVTGGSWGAGRALHNRRLLIEDLRRTAAQLQDSRDELATRAVAEERLRIAQDIHDVVAHSVTVMLVQAEAAERLLPDAERAAAARQAIAAVQESGRNASVELRQLLGVLRPAESSLGLQPQPRLSDLAQLLEHCREAGLAVNGTEVGGPLGLPANVELTAYRVAQEALTNVLRHSKARAATLVVQTGGNALEVEVADDGPARIAGGTPGHGIAGMRERVAACGGELSAGPDGQGFRVRARLPLTASR